MGDQTKLAFLGGMLLTLSFVMMVIGLAALFLKHSGACQ